jgi:hypothetical protein
LILEIPDLDWKVIEDPTPEDIMRGLKSLDGGLRSDLAIRLDASDLTYMQAIGCPERGFDIEFQLGSLDQHFKSTTKLPLALTHEILCLYLVQDPVWKQLFRYSWFDVRARQRLYAKTLRETSGPLGRPYWAISGVLARRKNKPQLCPPESHLMNGPDDRSQKSG